MEEEYLGRGAHDISNIKYIIIIIEEILEKQQTNN